MAYNRQDPCCYPLQAISRLFGVVLPSQNLFSATQTTIEHRMWGRVWGVFFSSLTKVIGHDSSPRQPVHFVTRVDLNYQSIRLWARVSPHATATQTRCEGLPLGSLGDGPLPAGYREDLREVGGEEDRPGSLRDGSLPTGSQVYSARAFYSARVFLRAAVSGRGGLLKLVPRYCKQWNITMYCNHVGLVVWVL